MKRYVVFLNEYGPEIYATGIFCDQVMTSDDVEKALEFPTARQAYYWAGLQRLDYWRVGER